MVLVGCVLKHKGTENISRYREQDQYCSVTKPPLYVCCMNTTQQIASSLAQPTETPGDVSNSINVSFSEPVTHIRCRDDSVRVATLALRGPSTPFSSGQVVHS
ncbi:hypothetical protein CBL_03352 [Carabus blaptoides fortunei]